jgi:hypothetical protein
MPIEWDSQESAPAGGKIAWDDEQPDSGGLLQQGVYGFNRGLAKILPYQLLPEGAERFVEERFLGSERPPQGMAERIAGRTGQEVGATAPLAALTMGLAPLAPAVSQAGNAVQRGAAALMEGIRSTPGRAAIGELVSATGAGAGAGIAQEIAPGSAGAEMTGQLAGGVAPLALAAAPTRWIMKGGKWVLERVVPPTQPGEEPGMIRSVIDWLLPNRGRVQGNAAGQAVQATIGGELTPGALEQLRQADEIAGRVPGFRPSLAEGTGSPALVATQRALERGLTGKDLEMAAMRRQGNERALETFATRQAPPGKPVEFVIDAATRSVNDIRAGITGKQGEMTAMRQQLAEQRLPIADRSKIGFGMRDQLLVEQRRAAAELAKTRANIGIDQADVTVPFGQFAADVAAMAPDSPFRDLRRYPDIMQIIRRVGADEVPSGAPKTYEGGPNEPPIGSLESAYLDPSASLPEPTQVNVSFSDLVALREEIGFQVRNAEAAANPDFRKVRLLVGLRQKLDDTLEGLDFPDPGLSAAYKQYRQQYFTDYVERFRKGAAWEVRRKDGRGFYRTEDENVATTFFRPGDVEAARQFNAIYRGNPEADAGLAAVALDDLRDAAVRDGQLDPRLYETWLRKHRSVLDQFPALRTKIAELGSANQGLLAREAELLERSQAIEDQVLVKSLNAISGGTKTPPQLVAEALKNPMKMGQMKAIIRGNEAAEQAWARAVWDAAAGQKDIGQFIAANEPALKLALSSRHIDDLKILAQGSEILARVPAPSGGVLQSDPAASLQKALGGVKLTTLESRISAVRQGRTNWRTETIALMSRFMRGYSQDQSAALLQEALYDPQVARDLANTMRFRTLTPVIARRLNVRLFNLGMNTREQQGEEMQPVQMTPGYSAIP